MFLMIGIEEGRKDLEYHKTVICRNCGRYGRYVVFMTFTSLLLFFIPCFKWNKQYFVQMSCCGRLYSLNPEIGKRIAKGEAVEIRPEDLEPVGGRQNSGGFGYAGFANDRESGSTGSAFPKKSCFYCGYETTEDFDYCPKCGRKFD